MILLTRYKWTRTATKFASLTFIPLVFMISLGSLLITMGEQIERFFYPVVGSAVFLRSSTCEDCTVASVSGRMAFIKYRACTIVEVHAQHGPFSLAIQWQRPDNVMDASLRSRPTGLQITPRFTVLGLSSLEGVSIHTTHRCHFGWDIKTVVHNGDPWHIDDDLKKALVEYAKGSLVF